LSKQHGDGFQVPIPLIILGYIISPPVGIVLTVLRVLGSGGFRSGAADGKEQKDTGTARSAVNAEELAEKIKKEIKNNKEKAVKKKTEARKRICVPAMVLYILAGVFLLCTLLGITNLSSFSFSVWLEQTLVFLTLAVGTFIPAQILNHRHNRRNVIRSIIGRRETMQLKQIASAADMSLKRLRRDLQGMIDKGEFGDEAYIDLAAGRFMRHPDEEEENSPAEPANTVTPNEDTDRFRAIILQIRKLNDDIKDYAVSERIYRIEEHTQNIFDYVTEHPEAMPQIRTFMNYYLPTTLKLLASYSRIEQVGVAGENMKKSKENIEKTLDMLVVGFEQQVDQLFRNESMDISSEITVLEAMMKQDGLDGRNDFGPEAVQGYTDGYTDDLSDSAAAVQKPKKTDPRI